jgi:SAM-dependent MidA family methyltransferase
LTDDITVALRAGDEGEPPTYDTGDPKLVELIRSEIEWGGPITFERFMERALYQPGIGYYAVSAVRPTREGDFLTAPELHPIFGWTIATQVHEMWERLGKPDEFVLREYGAGSGSLGGAITDGLDRLGSKLDGVLRYEPVEIEGRLPSAADSAPMVGCVIGNEFLDALPVHRLVMTDTGLREIYIAWQQDRFVEVAGELSDPRLASTTGADDQDLAVGHQLEVNLRMGEWLAELGAQIERGYVLLIDYGLPRSQLLAPERASGTIRAFRGQHVSSDVLSGVGHQDITAHVDLDALESDARSSGFEVLGRTTQASFLMGCGLDEIYRGAKEQADRDWSSALEVRSAVRRLLDPTHLGAYAVVVLGKGVETEPPLRGLTFRLERHD